MEKELLEEIYELKREIQNWRFIAAWLASCHAATMESLPASASKSAKRRHVNICQKAVKMFRERELPDNKGFQPVESIIESDIQRCEQVVAAYFAR